MTEDPFTASAAADGVHHWLGKLAGEWEGTTRIWLRPGELHSEDPNRGTIRPIVGGHFLLHEYETAVQGAPSSGAAIYGYDLDGGRYQAAWVDEWHTRTGIMFSEGEGEGSGWQALASYGPPEEPWGWRTEIELTAGDVLIITAYNITPDGQEAKAVETVYRRAVNS